MKKDQRFEFKLTSETKKKLLRDSALNGYFSPSAYLAKLIDIGPPVSEDLDIRLQLIEKKVEVYGNNLEIQNKKIVSLTQDIFKRNYIIYRIVAFLLSRSFFIKRGKVSEEDIDDSNRFIEEQLDNYMNRFENTHKS